MFIKILSVRHRARCFPSPSLILPAYEACMIVHPIVQMRAVRHGGIG